MASVFGDGMVLQQGMVAPIWGSAAAGENVSITFQGQTKATTANASGKWRIDLSSMTASGAAPMTISATNIISYSGVYVGDVYVLSGQSNMAYAVNSSSDRAWALTQNDPLLRLNNASGASWQAATGGPDGPIDTFSATGYYFGKALLTAHPNVPIGLINRSISGTWIQTWTPKDICVNQMGYNSSDGGGNYGQIQALQPYAVKGVVWYQGEYNDQTYNYDEWMRQMIGGWRRDWGQGDFAFMYVQLPRYGSPGATNPNDSWAMVRQCQTAALNTPNTGMAIYYDVSDGGLHPAQKKTIGDRLALLDRNMVYGEGAASDFRSPVLDTVSVAGKVATFTFKYADNGLKLGSGTSIEDLTLLSPDGSMKSSTGTISGNKVIVDCSAESVMPNIYYAWKVYPQGNLFNTAGLPVSPFSLVNFQPVPTAPSDLSATAASNSQINLSWTDKSNDEIGFKIERATDSGFMQNLTFVTTTAANTTSYSNSGLVASTLYYYRVRAINSTGDSVNSNSANATTLASSLRDPENPGNTIPGLDRRHYSGTWTALPDFDSLTPDVADISTNFTITAGADSYGYTFTGFVNAPTDGFYTFYTSSDDGSNLYIGTTQIVSNDGLHSMSERSGLIGLKAGRHAIKVTYFENSGGEGLSVSWAGPGISKQSIPDASLFRRPSGGVPAAPSGLSVTAVSSSQIDLRWTDNSSNETGFKIERATDSGFTQNLILATTSLATVTSYSDTGLSANTQYYYRLRATSSAGDSANSNTASATTQASGLLTDNCNNLSLVYSSTNISVNSLLGNPQGLLDSGTFQLTNAGAGQTGSVIYQASGQSFSSFQMQVFFWGNDTVRSRWIVEVSDTAAFTTSTALTRNYSTSVLLSSDPYYSSNVTTSTTIPSNAKYLRIRMSPYNNSASTQAIGQVVLTSAAAAPAAPTLVSTQINDGNAQRSMIKNMTYTFSSPVALSSGAFTLTRRSDGLLVPVTTTPASNGVTFATTYILSFGGTSILGGSLADGVYDLVLHTSQVQDAYNQSIAGGDQTLSFHRLFGDVNGDGSVNSTDNFRVRSAFGTSAGNAGYLWYLDYTNDGSINSADNFQLRSRFGLSFSTN